MTNSEVIKNESKFLITYLAKRKIGILTKKLKIHIFDLKYTDYNKYVVESSDIVIR